MRINDHDDDDDDDRKMAVWVVSINVVALSLVWLALSTRMGNLMQAAKRATCT